MSDLMVRDRSAAANYVAPIAQSRPHTVGLDRHLKRSFADYEVAKAHILQALGDLMDLRVHGRQVIVAAFCRPNVNMIKKPDGTMAALYMPLKEIQEDWYQHKAGLLVKMGPSAFSGDQSYLDATYPDGNPPGIGDWVFANPSSGHSLKLQGDGGSRPQAVDQAGNPMDLYEWDGWPCRVISDDVIWFDHNDPQAGV